MALLASVAKLFQGGLVCVEAVLLADESVKGFGRVHIVSVALWFYGSNHKNPGKFMAATEMC